MTVAIIIASAVAFCVSFVVTFTVLVNRHFKKMGVPQIDVRKYGSKGNGEAT